MIPPLGRRGEFPQSMTISPSLTVRTKTMYLWKLFR